MRTVPVTAHSAMNGQNSMLTDRPRSRWVRPYMNPINRTVQTMYRSMRSNRDRVICWHYSILICGLSSVVSLPTHNTGLGAG
jgi:hypothetical protein